MFLKTSLFANKQSLIGARAHWPAFTPPIACVNAPNISAKALGRVLVRVAGRQHQQDRCKCAGMASDEVWRQKASRLASSQPKISSRAPSVLAARSEFGGQGANFELDCY